MDTKQREGIPIGVVNRFPLCPYKHPVGDGFHCTCPVRKEIYRRYGR
jgi:hypothetical protein